MMDDGIVGSGMAGVWMEPTQAHTGRAEEKVTGSQNKTKWGKGERGASKQRHKPKPKPKSDL